MKEELAASPLWNIRKFDKGWSILFTSSFCCKKNSIFNYGRFQRISGRLRRQSPTPLSRPLSCNCWESGPCQPDRQRKMTFESPRTSSKVKTNGRSMPQIPQPPTSVAIAGDN